ncbi:hypothetical protein SDC9_152209 [bioreactor metagenome]|uniref:Uncharacterized protein n=1 Tax=bioreactor metagenome TaxID=1076179 RepID=A0A645EU48_9ZZZZ
MAEPHRPDSGPDDFDLPRLAVGCVDEADGVESELLLEFAALFDGHPFQRAEPDREERGRVSSFFREKRNPGEMVEREAFSLPLDDPEGAAAHRSPVERRVGELVPPGVERGGQEHEPAVVEAAVGREFDLRITALQVRGKRHLRGGGAVFSAFEMDQGVVGGVVGFRRHMELFGQRPLRSVASGGFQRQQAFPRRQGGEELLRFQDDFSGFRVRLAG